MVFPTLKSFYPQIEKLNTTPTKPTWTFRTDRFCGLVLGSAINNVPCYHIFPIPCTPSHIERVWFYCFTPSTPPSQTGTQSMGPKVSHPTIQGWVVLSQNMCCRPFFLLCITYKHDPCVLCFTQPIFARTTFLPPNSLGQFCACSLGVDNLEEKKAAYLLPGFPNVWIELVGPK